MTLPRMERSAEWRVTRAQVYTADCPGYNNLSARQGHYVTAPSASEAIDKFREEHPEWAQEQIDVQAWRIVGATSHGDGPEPNQKELDEANAFLQQMHLELSEWKTDVLGFRDEIRKSQKAQLEALGKILSVLGAEPVTIPDAAPAESDK